jgi:hypothetical protein
MATLPAIICLEIMPNACYRSVLIARQAHNVHALRVDSTEADSC